MNELAPIIVFAYNRPKHLRKTLSSLERNVLIDESKIYFYSDGAKNHSDEHKVSEVRNIIESFSKGKRVQRIYRDSNLGLANSVISGVTDVLESHDSVIVLEDDLVSSKNFLDYMNDALSFYKNNEKVFSISGYSLPLKRKMKISDDVFFLPRTGSWGWATWKNRWKKADWEVKDYDEFRSEKDLIRRFNIGGEDLTPMLKAQINGFINSWAIRWGYTLYKNDGVCVYPKYSKVVHIGNDYEGTHFNRTNKYDVEIDELCNKTNFTHEITFDDEILKEINSIVKPSIQRRVINYFKYDFMK